MIIVSKDGARGISIPEKWVKVATACCTVKLDMADTVGKTTYAVLATFVSLVMQRFWVDGSEVFIRFVCEFVNFGIRDCEVSDGSWDEIEELWYLTIQVFESCTSQSYAVSCEVLEQDWVPEWLDSLKMLNELSDEMNESLQGLVGSIAVCTRMDLGSNDECQSLALHLQSLSTR